MSTENKPSTRIYPAHIPAQNFLNYYNYRLSLKNQIPFTNSELSIMSQFGANWGCNFYTFEILERMGDDAIGTLRLQYKHIMSNVVLRKEQQFFLSTIVDDEPILKPLHELEECDVHIIDNDDEKSYIKFAIPADVDEPDNVKRDVRNIIIKLLDGNSMVMHKHSQQRVRAVFYHIKNELRMSVPFYITHCGRIPNLDTKLIDLCPNGDVYLEIRPKLLGGQPKKLLSLDGLEDLDNEDNKHSSPPPSEPLIRSEIIEPASNFDYYDLINKKGYSLQDFINMKSRNRINNNQSAAGVINDLRGQLRKKREAMFKLEPLPQPFRITDDSNISFIVSNVHPKPQRITRDIIETGVEVYTQPVLMPDMKESHIKISVIVDGVPQIIEEPVWELEIITVDKNRIAKLKPQIPYLPLYSASAYWANIIIALRDMIAGETYIEQRPILHDLDRDLIRTASLKYFGVRYEGQIKRLRDVNAVHVWASKQESVFSIKAFLRRSSDQLKSSSKDKVQNLTMAKSKIKSLAVLSAIAQEKVFRDDCLRSYVSAVQEIYPFTAPMIVPSLEQFAQTRALEVEWTEKWDLGGGEIPPFPLVSFDPNSNAGPIWNDGSTQKTHREVIFSEFIMAREFMSSVDAIVVRAGNSPPDQREKILQEGAVSLSEAYRWLWTGFFKPKAEVYDIPGAHFGDTVNPDPTKTRNIEATNTCAFIPSMMIASLTYKMSPNIFESPRSRNLLGFSAYKGGMTALFKFMIFDTITTEPGMMMVHTLVYADNLYVYGTIFTDNEYQLIFLSLDGEKMEATIMYDDVYLESLRQLETLNTLKMTDKGGVRAPVNPTLSFYQTSIVPSLVTDQIAILGSTQFKLPGMGSGSVGTANYNTAKMAGIASQLEGKLIPIDDIVSKDSSLGRALSKAAEQCGVKLTLEVSQRLALGRDANAWYRYKNFLNHYDKQVIQLDLLGNDAYVVANVAKTIWNEGTGELQDLDEPGIIMATLARQRLINSSLFHKFTYYQRKSRVPDDKEQSIMHIILLRVLYLIGGFAYADLSTLYRYMINNLMRQIDVVDGSTINRQKIDLFLSDFMIDDDDNILRTALREISVLGIPKLEDLLKLHGHGRGYRTPFGVMGTKLCQSFMLKTLHFSKEKPTPLFLPEFARVKIAELANNPKWSGDQLINLVQYHYVCSNMKYLGRYNEVYAKMYRSSGFYEPENVGEKTYAFWEVVKHELEGLPPQEDLDLNQVDLEYQRSLELSFQDPKRVITREVKTVVSGPLITKPKQKKRFEAPETKLPVTLPAGTKTNVIKPVVKEIDIPRSVDTIILDRLYSVGTYTDGRADHELKAGLGEASNYYHTNWKGEKLIVQNPTNWHYYFEFDENPARLPYERLAIMSLDNVFATIQRHIMESFTVRLFAVVKSYIPDITLPQLRGYLLSYVKREMAGKSTRRTFGLTIYAKQDVLGLDVRRAVYHGPIILVVKNNKVSAIADRSNLVMSSTSTATH